MSYPLQACGACRHSVWGSSWGWCRRPFVLSSTQSGITTRSPGPAMPLRPRSTPWIEASPWKDLPAPSAGSSEWAHATTTYSGNIGFIPLTGVSIHSSFIVFHDFMEINVEKVNNLVKLETSFHFISFYWFRNIHRYNLFYTIILR